MTFRQFINLQYGLVRSFFGHPVPISEEERSIVDKFHELYYNRASTGGTWTNTTWLGCGVLKCPFDLWTYQELIFELKPELIIETGTFDGGSAIFMATLCDFMNKGKIVSVDINPNPRRPQHPRVTYITGSSVAPEILGQVKSHIKGGTVMVILDSDHSQSHVAKELASYPEFVTRGSYLIVEDTAVNGHPVAREHGPGPMEALDDFLKTNNSFEIDRSREKFLLTFNPRGYLRKVK